jgi:hypothetical protein
MTGPGELRELRFVIATEEGATSLRMLTTEPRAREFAAQALAEAAGATSVEVWDGQALLFRLGRTSNTVGA